MEETYLLKLFRKTITSNFRFIYNLQSACGFPLVFNILHGTDSILQQYWWYPFTVLNIQQCYDGIPHSTANTFPTVSLDGKEKEIGERYNTLEVSPFPCLFPFVATVKTDNIKLLINAATYMIFSNVKVWKDILIIGKTCFLDTWKGEKVSQVIHIRGTQTIASTKREGQNQSEDKSKVEENSFSQIKIHFNSHFTRFS